MTEAANGAARTIDWYYDILSPFAYLQLHDFHRLPAGVRVVAKPVLLGAVLKHWGQRGPAEIEPKRLHTYRMAQWRADERGIPMRLPPRHPFNPLKPLRVMAAIGPDMDAVRKAFGFVFREGRAAESGEELAAFGAALGIADAEAVAASQEAKDALRVSTEEAIARGVFGVPTFHAEGELFWGDDATGMLVAWLADRSLFSRGEMARFPDLPVGIRREATPPGG